MEKQLYTLYLNDKIYGKGDWNFMQELMNDWVSTMDMYGDEEANFKVVKTKFNGTPKGLRRNGQFLEDSRYSCLTSPEDIDSIVKIWYSNGTRPDYVIFDEGIITGEEE